MAQTITKHIGEGFAKGELYSALNFNHKDLMGGQKIGGIYCDGILAPNGSFQGTYVQSATQNYLLGTRRITIDGRIFKYGKCTAARTTGYCMMFNGGLFSKFGTDGGAVLPVAITAGDTSCTVTIAATDGSNQGEYEAADGAVAADELYGGYLVLYGASNDRENRMILGNTAKAAGAGTIVIYVEEPFTESHTTSIKVEVMGNPWATLAMVAEDYISVAGFPACGNVTNGYYFWCQTWGPIRMSGQNYNLGETAGERNLWFGPDGSVRSTAIQGATNCRQHAGFLIPRTNASVGLSGWMMLELSI